jgi:hypothetical protein
MWSQEVAFSRNLVNVLDSLVHLTVVCQGKVQDFRRAGDYVPNLRTLYLNGVHRRRRVNFANSRGTHIFRKVIHGLYNSVKEGSIVEILLLNRG